MKTVQRKLNGEPEKKNTLESPCRIICSSTFLPIDAPSILEDRVERQEKMLMIS